MEGNRNILQMIVDGVEQAYDAVKEGPVGQGIDILQAISESPGAAPLHAAWRGGLKDLQDALIPAFPDSMHPREEPGSIASPTAQLVTENITGRNVDLAQDTIKPHDFEMER